MSYTGRLRARIKEAATAVAKRVQTREAHADVVRKAAPIAERPPGADERWQMLAEAVGAADAAMASLYVNPSTRRATEEVVYIDNGDAGKVPPLLRSGVVSRAASERWVTGVARPAEEVAPERQGGSGTPFLGGLPRVDPNDRMQPYMARGLTTQIGTLQQMEREHPVIRSAMRRCENNLAQATWQFRRPDVDYERVARVMPVDLDALDRLVEVLNVEVFANPDVSSAAVIREQSRMGIAGFSLHEVGIDPRAKGCRVTFVEGRAASSVQRWLFDTSKGAERWVAVEQNIGGTVAGTQAVGGSGGGGGIRVLDRRKLIHCAVSQEGVNLEGISDVRAGYGAAAIKREFLLQLLQRTQRWGGKFPVVKVTDPNKLTDVTFQNSVRQAMSRFYSDRNSFMSLPYGVELEMMSIEGSSDTLEMVKWCDQQLLWSLGAIAMSIGQTATGSYALASVQTREELKQLQGYANTIADGWKAFVRLYAAACLGGATMHVLPELVVTGIANRSDDETIRVWEGNARIESLVRVDGSPAYSTAENNERRVEIGLPPITEDSDADAEPSGAVPGDSPKVQAIAALVASQLAAARRAPIQRAKAGEVIVRGRDGLPFATHRTLTQREQCVAWRSLSTLLDVADVATADDLARVAVAHRTEFVRQANERIAVGDYVGIGAMYVDLVDQYAAAAAQSLDAVAKLGARDMTQEIRAIAGPLWTPEPEPSSFSESLDAIKRAQALSLGQKACDAWNQRMRDAALRAGANGDAVRSAINALEIPTADFARFAKTADSVTLSAAREVTAAAKGPEIVGADYTAIMDRVTCPECRARDGVRYVYGSSAYKQDSPPLQVCKSTLGPLGNACRCLWQYEFAVEDGLLAAA